MVERGLERERKCCCTAGCSPTTTGVSCVFFLHFPWFSRSQTWGEYGPFVVACLFSIFLPSFQSCLIMFAPVWGGILCGWCVFQFLLQCWIPRQNWHCAAKEIAELNNEFLLHSTLSPHLCFRGFPLSTFLQIRSSPPVRLTNTQFNYGSDVVVSFFLVITTAPVVLDRPSITYILYNKTTWCGFTCGKCQ